METPVYLFTGFLEAGKTQFIQQILSEQDLGAGTGGAVGRAALMADGGGPLKPWARVHS